MAAASLISDLEDVVQRGTPEKCGEMIRRITALFLDGAPRLNEDHVRLFDDVFIRLIEEIEVRARAELARRLAPVANAPLKAVRRLAKDEDISVAGPVLEQSARLNEIDLLDIAKSKGQAHLFAISSRAGINESIADILVHRGDRDVLRKVTGNLGAQFSESGYSSLVKRAEQDGVLAEMIVCRSDVPDHLFRELLVRATEVVRDRLLAAARPETQADIRRVLARVSSEVGAGTRPIRNYEEAVRKVRALDELGKLDESELVEFAKTNQYEETVAALAELSAAPVEVVGKLMDGERPDPVLILCKAAGFDWTTARSIILARPGNQGKAGPSLEAAFANFDKLSPSTAKRVVRFWQVAKSNTRAAR